MATILVVGRDNNPNSIKDTIKTFRTRLRVIEIYLVRGRLKKCVGFDVLAS